MLPVLKGICATGITGVLFGAPDVKSGIDGLDRAGIDGRDVTG